AGQPRVDPSTGREVGRVDELRPGPAGVGRVPLCEVSTRKGPAMTTAHLSRRQALKTAGAGFGYLALAGLPRHQAPATDKPRPLARRKPHSRAKAKRIIFLFMEGATSQMDTWEYKPQLQKDDARIGPGGGTLVASKFKWAQHGQTGTWI